MPVTYADGNGYLGRERQLPSAAPTDSVEAGDGIEADSRKVTVTEILKWENAHYEVIARLIDIDPSLPPGIGRVRWISREELKKLYPMA